MAFGNNNYLVKGATLKTVDNNGTNDVIANNASDNQATAFSFSNGATGDDSIENFGRNDTILNYKKIFDGNNDGIIDFGPNGILDIDRSTKSNPGADQITLQGLASKQLRYLGAKENGGDHSLKYVYADASVRTEAFAHAMGQTGVEQTVGNDTHNAAAGSYVYLYDTQLGLNLGGDTIDGFGSDDLLVTTSAIFNGSDGIWSGQEITFGGNGVLDLSGEVANTKGDDGASHGGQIAMSGLGTEGHGLYLQYTYTSVDGDPATNDVTYYYYGTTPPAADAALAA